MTTGAVTADSRRFAAMAMGGIAVMMAYQVASRAVRDTLFLSLFSPRTLPLMVAAASALSIACALGAGRLLSRHGPARVVPGAMALSGLLTLAEWPLAALRPAIGAVVVYLHVSAIAPVLLSGFWSILNERFDPRTAKRVIGRVSAIGTLGGLAGGVLAERGASWLGVPGTLALLALLQGWCAWSLRGLVARGRRHSRGREGSRHVPAAQAVRQLATTSYLRNLALLVVGSSVSASLLDYVFKAQSAGAMSPGLGLMRLFAAFYAVVSLLTFAIQALLTRAVLGRAGVAPSIGALPAAVVAGGVVAAAVPGPLSVAFARGLESVLRGSLFRSGYELLYTPIPAAEKRATKAIVDVGCDRLGDMVGAGLVALVLVLPSTSVNLALIALAVAFALATLALVARLQSGYVSSLEAGLRAGAGDLDSAADPDWSVAQSLTGSFGVPGLPATPGARAGVAAAVSAAKPAPAAASFHPPALADDTLVAGLRELRSGDPGRVRAALVASSPLDPGLVAQGIALLAWDEVATDVIRALRAVATRHAGQLVDALLDPGTEFTVRRRIPPVLAVSHARRAVDGLVNGLVDTRFEVRYRCGRALDGLRGADPRLGVDEALVYEAVRRETRVGRAVWNSQKLLEQLEETGHETFVDDFVRHRAGRSLEHVFTLLALVLPREPLRIAFAGLNAGNASLRGLALEYLESVLPPDVRDELWPYLEERPRSPGDGTHRVRARGEVLEDLMRSNQSIQLGLENLRRARQPDAGSAAP